MTQTRLQLSVLSVLGRRKIVKEQDRDCKEGVEEFPDKISLGLPLQLLRNVLGHYREGTKFRGAAPSAVFFRQCQFQFLQNPFVIVLSDFSVLRENESE